MNWQSRTQALALAALGLFGVATANAATYLIDPERSTLSDVRHIGRNLIPDISQYSNTNAFLLDPTDARTWPLLSGTLGLWDPLDPTARPPIVPVAATVGGSLQITDGVLSGATIAQLSTLSHGFFQSATNIGDMLVNDLIWSYDPTTGQLNHQESAGSGGYAVCVPALPDSFSSTAQCNQLQAAVNSSGQLGQSTIANSWLNWDGIPDGYLVFDNQTAPWHSGTGASLLVGPQAAVTWDLTDFVAGEGGIIRARVISGILSGQNSGAYSALFTLHVVVPVPAGIWLLGSALVLLAWMRRKLYVR